MAGKVYTLSRSKRFFAAANGCSGVDLSACNSGGRGSIALFTRLRFELVREAECDNRYVTPSSSAEAITDSIRNES